MARFEPDDIRTVYFIVTKGKHKGVQAWTFSKTIAEYYLAFHKCKDFKLKSMTATVKEISLITEEENYHNEIQIHNLRTANPKDPDDPRPFLIQVPMTKTEHDHVVIESQTFLQTEIDYHLLAEGIDWLEPEYQKLIGKTGINDIVRFMVHNKQSKFVESVVFDQLKLLFHTFPDTFGE